MLSATVVGFLGSFAAAALAQAFSVGETVICMPTGSESDWREGVVMENNPNLSYVRIKCGPAKNGNPGNIFLVDRKDIRKEGDPGAQQKAAGTSPGTPGANSPLHVAQSVMCLATGNEHDIRPGKILENNPTLDYVRIECPAGADGRPGGIFLVGRKDVWTPGAAGAPQQKAPLAAAVAQNGPSLSMITPSPSVSSAQTTSAAHSTNQNTKSAPNSNCACPTQTQADGSSAEDNIKRNIIARYVRNGGALDSNHTPSTVHFHSFQIVRQRPYAMPVPGAYHTGSPDGPGGKMGTQVYEVVCKYTVCVDYHGSTYTGYKGRIEEVDHDAGYTCFIDTQGAWRCNQNKDSMTTRNTDK